MGKAFPLAATAFGLFRAPPSVGTPRNAPRPEAEHPAEEYKQIFDEQRRRNRLLFRSMTNAQLDDVTHRTVRHLRYEPLHFLVAVFVILKFETSSACCFGVPALISLLL